MSSGRRAYDILRSFVNTEWERIRGIDYDKALEELNSPPVDSSSTSSLDQLPSPTPPDPMSTARSVLGVPEDASFEDIRKAFERLSSRSEPTRFTAGSEEQVHATQIQARVNWAYKLLTAEVSTTEKRFKSLEID